MATEINRIVLDLDDTLNSFTMHLLDRLGCGVGPFEYHKFPTECGYDIIGAWSTLTGRPRVEVPMFWEWVTQRMWADAPRSNQFWLLEAAADFVGAENVLIATVPTKSAGCLAGKYQWIEEHLPDWAQRQYSITPRKHWNAQPGTLLIDDSHSNCDKFVKCGGHSLIVPRPWNWAHKSHTSIYLSSTLGEFDFIKS